MDGFQVRFISFMWEPPFSGAILVFGCTWKRGGYFGSQGLQCCTQTSRKEDLGPKSKLKNTWPIQETMVCALTLNFFLLLRKV